MHPPSTATPLPPAATASPLSARLASEAELWRRRGADPRAREELIRRYLGLASSLARRYRQGNEPFDDLLQVSHYALLRAVERYDPDRGVPFAGFAAPTILGELKRHFRDRTTTVRLPRGLHDLLQEVQKASDRLTVELQRSPSVPEIAEFLGVAPLDVLEVLEADHNRRTLSLDMPGEEGDDNNPMSELIGTEDLGYEHSEDRLAVEGAVEGLDQRDREILRLRFVEDLTQSEIAAVIGTSQMQVSRLLRRILTEIRESVGAPIDDAAGKEG